jgi:hypothetical protein
MHRSHPARLFRLRAGLALALAGLLLTPLRAQQRADLAFAPPIAAPAFPADRGPVVLVDEAHHNFHTTTGRYQPFAALLRRDGYVVRGLSSAFTPATLAPGRLLVVANPLHARNARDGWSLPTPPAFSAAEVAAVHAWVEAGGALLLIADHMPFPGAAENLAAAFGFTFSNGFARDAAARSVLTFTAARGLAADHPAVRGRSPADHVTSVTAFTGSAFRPPATATSLLTLPADSVSLEPQTAWKFEPATTRTIPVGGWSQGAVLTVGHGRVAVFAEAAMFSAQLSGAQNRPMGMNSPDAPQNARFLLNLIRWLTAAD